MVLLVLVLQPWFVVLHVGGEAGQLLEQTAASAHFEGLQKWSNLIIIGLAKPIRWARGSYKQSIHGASQYLMQH